MLILQDMVISEKGKLGIRSIACYILCRKGTKIECMLFAHVWGPEKDTQEIVNCEMHKTEMIGSWLGTRLCTAYFFKADFMLTFSMHIENHTNLGV